MLKILCYLRKTTISVIAIVLLLCIQAAADLALPDYTSKIVNIGIQQNGIENQSPEVIRKSKLDDLSLFFNNKEEVLNKYTLVSKDSIDNSKKEEYLEKYPELNNQEL